MFQLVVYNPNEHFQVHIDGATCVGAKSVEAQKQAASTTNDTPRIEISDCWLSANQLQLTPIDDKTFELKNFGKSILLSNGKRLQRGKTIELEIPDQIWVGKSVLSFGQQESCGQESWSILQSDQNEDSLSDRLGSLGESPAPETLVQWFESLGRIQRSVAGSQQFYNEAAYAVFEAAGLDNGMILLLDENEVLQIAASHIVNSDTGTTYQQAMIDRVWESGGTVFHDATRVNSKTGDTAIDQFAVAAPIFGENNNILGVVYGSRRHHAKNNRLGIRPLEAQFITLLADSVSAGLVRLDREAQAAKNQFRLEQVFTPKIANALRDDPSLLEGQDRDVTVLFADLRGATKLSSQLNSKEFYLLMSDLWERLNSSIAENDGVIIDYYGDGFAAFWNAPFDQPNHHLLACKAALSIQNTLPDISQDWLPLTHTELRIGIGVHSGVAQVGNAGCNRKLKYGPRGVTVNVASRIEFATKYLGSSILITEAVRAGLGERLVTRRVCKCQLPDVGNEMNLYEVFSDSTAIRSLSTLRQYEDALKVLESGQPQKASEILKKSAFANDGVAKFLRSQIADPTARELLRNKNIITSFDGVINHPEESNGEAEKDSGETCQTETNLIEN